LRRPGTAHGQLAGAPPEGVEVARTEPPPRPGEQAYDGVARGGISEDAQGAHDVDHFGFEQQPAEAHDLARHAARTQLRLEPGEVRPLAGQHGDLLPRHGILVSAAQRSDTVGHPRSLVHHRLQQRAHHSAGSLPAGSRSERAAIESLHGDAARDLVGDCEDRRSVAEAHRQAARVGSPLHRRAPRTAI
jgi:hypothetical protein